MAGSSHGHTPAAWTGVTIAFIGFCISGVFMVAANVPGVVGGLVVILLGGAVGLGMKAAGMGMPKESAELVRARNAAGNKQVNMRSEDIKTQLLSGAHTTHSAHGATAEAQPQTV